MSLEQLPKKRRPLPPGAGEAVWIGREDEISHVLEGGLTVRG
jgi:hypothetical protein